MSRGQGRVYKRPGSEHWWLDYGVRGARHRESSHTTNKAEALDLLRRRVGDRKEGRLVGRPDQVTLTELRAALERHYRQEGNRSLTRAQQALVHLESFLLPTTRALAITRARVGEYIAHRLAQGAARATVHYEVAILNSAFSVAVDDELLTLRPEFKLPAVSNVRTDFFGPGELAALLLELPPVERAVVELLYATGWRTSEALELTWADVEWDDQATEGATEPVPGPNACVRLAAADTKGEDARLFPFQAAPTLRAVLLARWRDRKDVLVFHRDGQPISSLRAAWGHAVKRAGLEGMRVHDLRRTAARDFRRRGVSEGEIMKLCGWKTRSMFDRYNIIDEQDLALAVAKRFGGNGTGPSTGAAQAPSGTDAVSPSASQ
jgi:integrase